jgi:hypothetical protein
MTLKIIKFRCFLAVDPAITDVPFHAEMIEVYMMQTPCHLGPATASGA